jgi:predicted AAA+ superfamily ATPase
MLNRSISDYVLQRLSQIPIVALTGPRQVGKTTLAKQIREVIQEETIYLDLESDEDRNKLTDAERYLHARSDKLLIIDEVQRMPELFPVLRSVIDRKRSNGRFILLGSASPELLVRSSETLAGRIAYIEVHPFHFNEVREVASWQKLWLRGGYPDALLHGDDTTSFINRTDLIRTYLERELPMLGLPGSSVALSRNLLRMLGHVHGNLLNYSDLSRSLGVHINTVRNIIIYFENTYLIRLLQPWHFNISKRLVKSPKVYIRDSGIFHALSGIENEEELEGFHQKGASWEGFVIQQIISVLKPTMEYYFYHTQDGSELDLVLVKGSRPVLGIEVKSTNAPKLSRGNTIAAGDLGGIPLLIVTPSVSEDYELKPGQRVTSFDRVLGHEWLEDWVVG